MQKISVSSLIRYLKNKLDTDNNLQNIFVCGEITNFHRHYSGHLYFSLKDQYSSINCVMFKSSASNLDFEPKTGDKVVLVANTSIFETSGQLQLYVLKMELDGLGNLYQQFELLKKKLASEGYFDENHKKKLANKYLEKVAVLTGDNSAAMSDIKTCFKRRWPIAKVDYYPILVQGNNAANSIIENLKRVDELDYDAILLCRGGGSFEDLFCFNDEKLVKTIYELNTFIVSGVGHEQDFTLVDFVSDLRAPTPTAAVELTTPNIFDVINLLDDYQNDLNSAIDNKLNNIYYRFDLQISRLLNYHKHINNLISGVDNDLKMMTTSLKFKFDLRSKVITDYVKQMNLYLNNNYENKKNILKRLSILLNAYSCDNILDKGYTLIFQDDKLIKRKTDLKNKEFNIKFKDGELKAIERK